MWQNKVIFFEKYFPLLSCRNINVVMIARFITATSAQLSHCEILSCFFYSYTSLWPFYTDTSYLEKFAIRVFIPWTTRGFQAFKIAYFLLIMIWFDRGIMHWIKIKMLSDSSLIVVVNLLSQQEFKIHRAWAKQQVDIGMVLMAIKLGINW